MAEFQWWLLIVGIVAGGGLVAIVFMESNRNDWDVAEDERRAEATWISEWLASEGRTIKRDDAEAVLRAHRDYLALPPPDRLEPVATVRARASAAAAPASSADADADRQADGIGDDRGRGPDHDLPGAGEQQAPSGQ
jgi:hypothetical protein